MFEDLVVIAPLTAISVGDRFESGVGAVSLHLTLLPRIRVLRSRSHDVVEAVREVAASTGPVTATAIGRASFGHGSDVHVTTVEASKDVLGLHARLLDEACRAGAAPVTPAYSGPGYRPHITDTRDGQAVSPGGQVSLTTVAILDATQPTRCVVYKAKLSGPT